MHHVCSTNRASVLLNKISVSSKRRVTLAKKDIRLHQTEPRFEPKEGFVYVLNHYLCSLCNVVSTLGWILNLWVKEVIQKKTGCITVSKFQEKKILLTVRIKKNLPKVIISKAWKICRTNTYIWSVIMTIIWYHTHLLYGRNQSGCEKPNKVVFLIFYIFCLYENYHML